jgi:hypothetical protein
MRDIEVAVADWAQPRDAGLFDLGNEKIIQLNDVGHGATGSLDREIAEHLLDLRLEITLADQLAGGVARDLAGEIDDRPATDLCDVRIACGAGAISVSGLRIPSMVCASWSPVQAA